MRSYPDNFFLIGYRGAGKTTVARLVAERLGWYALDMDDALEGCHGRSIRTIFAEEGEAGFRRKEAELLEQLCAARQQVIATGGGIVLLPENRQRLRAAGHVIWLTADAATLWQRLEADASTSERRPDLSVGGLAEVEQLLRDRERWYRDCAHQIVSTAGHSPQEVADAIVDSWRLD